LCRKRNNELDFSVSSSAKDSRNDTHIMLYENHTKKHGKTQDTAGASNG
jgi:hypothetical protein